MSQHNHMRRLDYHFQERDSRSTHSTAHSYPKVEVYDMGGSQPHSQNKILLVTGYDGSPDKPSQNQNKSASFSVAHDFGFPTQVDYSQLIARIPLSFAEPYFDGVLASHYGSQAFVHHPQVMEMTSARVPLPLGFPQEKPIYVNAKQYRGILRRRQHRAKLEARKNAAKGRKPYLHESRHLHALRRVRGSGGRFLNMKKLQESNTTNMTSGMDMPCSAQSCFARPTWESEVYQPEERREGTSTASCSDVTSGSNSDGIFQPPDFSFSLFSGDR